MYGKCSYARFLTFAVNFSICTNMCNRNKNIVQLETVALHTNSIKNQTLYFFNNIFFCYITNKDCTFLSTFFSFFFCSSFAVSYCFPLPTCVVHKYSCFIVYDLIFFSVSTTQFKLV